MFFAGASWIWKHWDKVLFCCQCCAWIRGQIVWHRHQPTEEPQQQQQQQQQQEQSIHRRTKRVAPPPPVQRQNQLAPLPTQTAWRPAMRSIAMSGGAFEMVDLECQHSNSHFQVI